MSCERSSEIDFVDFLLEREDPRYAEFRAHYPGCPDCAEQVAQLTRLENELGHPAPSQAGPHPDEETLLAYAQTPASLGFDVRRGLETHLEACAPCRTELTVLERFDFEAIGVVQTAAQAESVSLWQTWKEGISSVLGEVGGWVSQPALAGAALAILLLPMGWFWLQGGPESPSGAGAGFAARPIEEEALPDAVELETGLPDASSLAAATPVPPAAEVMAPVEAEIEPEAESFQVAAETVKPRLAVPAPAQLMHPSHQNQRSHWRLGS